MSRVHSGGCRARHWRDRVVSLPKLSPRDPYTNSRESLLPYMSFQSTLGYLRSPPKGYLVPGVDIIGGLAAIREKLRKGSYKNQLEWALDMRQLWAAVSDGHFAYTPALLTTFFFERTLNMTSVSSDGLSLPKIYDINDVMSGSGLDSVSDIESIDGTPIQDFLGVAAAVQGTQDPDAQFNSLFWSIPGIGSVPGATFDFTLPDKHTVRFTNGTTRDYRNLASTTIDFSDIDSGEKLHAAVEIPPDTPPTKLRRRDDSDLPPAATSVPGYPSPVEIHRDGYIAGYFLNTTAHSNVAVLVLTSFESATDDSSSTPGAQTAEFEETRRVIRDFFAACAKAGRTKLIIDVSKNGGGLVFQGFEAYRNLFPKAQAWSGARLRANAALDIEGAATFGTPDQIESAILDPSTSKPYTSWDAMYGPKVFPEDRETNMLVYDFTNSSLTSEPNFPPFTITGSDPSDPPPKQPFAKDDIVVVTDGYCGSTCTIFVGLLQREAGVRTVALGGRPLSQPMQAVGGVKGSQVNSIAALQSTWSSVASISTLQNTSWSSVASVSTLQNTRSDAASIPASISSIFPTANDTLPPLQPTDLSSITLNYRNAYPQNAQSGPPAHFLYEAANCRRFYRPEHLQDMTTQWSDVADVAWGGAPCVPGSATGKNNTMADRTVGYSDAVLSKQSVYDGPGSLTNADWIALGKNRTGSLELIADATTSGAARVGMSLSVVVGVVLGMTLL
ncbi:hypothetical protein QBC47DRAFT_370366 [Echria macrotheca]|uniref:Tail specific protease domain-containing protein n=1 Tax=Echria macrotheca TaxID=438768 RepID=A0AAJ0BQH1_9PEZI|nr:hypothetical protein QBC47DRAFT_370366 [Echria macrotheca]